MATSSAEAELYSAAEGASRGLGLQSMLQEKGVQASSAVSTDSSSAKSFASTRGLGRMRHLEVKDLWFQALVKDGRVTLRKIPGSYTVSDVLTKYSDVACCTRLLGLAGIRVVPVESELLVSSFVREMSNPLGHDAQAALWTNRATRKECRGRRESESSDPSRDCVQSSMLICVCVEGQSVLFLQF